MGFIRLAAVSVVGAALAFAAPVAASATPGSPSKPHPTTTTTTAPSNNAQAFAKLVIKPSSVGHVNVKTANGSTFKPAKNGQSLHVGDTVQTDATGQAEIDYADTAYTRLDVNTTFTIKKLTDAQGNRQVEGSLDVGRTYNRTAALTQSQTFQQDAGGATAAVAGTAFVVTCTSATSCNFAAVIDFTNVSGPGGQIKNLNPLDECVANNGALCGTTTRLTPDELALIQWIQTNVYLDLAEHGIGDGVFQPFAGTVTVNNGQVQSFTPTTSGQGFTPQGSPSSPPGPPPPAPPILDANNPLRNPSDPTACDPSSTQCQNIVLEDDAPALAFSINTSDPNAVASAYYLLLTDLQGFGTTSTDAGILQAQQPHETNPSNIAAATHYDPQTNFTFTPNPVENTEQTNTGSFNVQAVNQENPAIASQQQLVTVTVNESPSEG